MEQRDAARTLSDATRALWSKAVSQRDDAIKDIHTIGLSLRDKAEEMGWCSEYGEFVAGLNASLTNPLPTREREFEVEMTNSVTLVQMVTVTAHNAEAAQEVVEDNGYPDEPNLDVDGDWEVSDFTQEEVCVNEVREA